MRRVLIIIIIGLFGIQVCASADYEAGQLGESVGGYVYAACLINELKNSPCGYLVRKEISLQPFVNDVESHLKLKNVKQFQNFMKNEMGIIKIEANHFITGFLQTTISESGFDECTACGMLFQNIATQMGQAEQKWERMKKKNNIPTLEELDWVEAELERMDKQKKAKKD